MGVRTTIGQDTLTKHHLVSHLRRHAALLAIDRTLHHGGRGLRQRAPGGRLTFAIAASIPAPMSGYASSSAAMVPYTGMSSGEVLMASRFLWECDLRMCTLPAVPAGQFLDG